MALILSGDSLLNASALDSSPSMTRRAPLKSLSAAGLSISRRSLVSRPEPSFLAFSFVVMRTTPWAPRSPYMAVLLAHFSTLILSMVLGSIVLRSHHFPRSEEGRVGKGGGRT